MMNTKWVAVISFTCILALQMFFPLSMNGLTGEADTDGAMTHYIDASLYDSGSAGASYRCGSLEWTDENTTVDVGTVGTHPPHWDWRNASSNGKTGDWITPVRDQGGCGSCWAFGALGALEALVNIREGHPDLDVDLSEQYVLSCLPEAGDCDGGWAYKAFKYIKSTGPDGNNHNGIIPESCFPYRARDDIPCSEKCEAWTEQLIPISDYGQYETISQDALRGKIYRHGPMAVSFTVYTDFYSYDGGVYTHTSGEKEGGHCVTVVGYDAEWNNGQGYWICKNSWGPRWGMDGYFKIACGECGIENWVKFADVDPSMTNWAPTADAGGPYYGYPGENIELDGAGSYDVDENIASYRWDFGDGANGTGPHPRHSYAEEGTYTVRLAVTDKEGKQGTDTALAYIDESAPTLAIERPRNNHLYVRDHEIMALPFTTWILGGITVEIDADDTISGMAKVVFYLNDERQVTVTEAPYRWEWMDTSQVFGQYIIKAVAYDNNGNTATKTMSVKRVW